jgi:hypothetical protein
MDATAYEFGSEESLEGLAQRLNGSGPWTWEIRDSHWYGDYLNCRPVPGVRVRIHDPSQFNTAEGPHFVNSSPVHPAVSTEPAEAKAHRAVHRYVCQLDVDKGINRSPHEKTLMGQLSRLAVVGLVDIPVYD